METPRGSWAMERKGRRGELFLAIEGELDVARAREAEARLQESQGPASRLVLDLSGVPRFDFTGIIVLIDALARVRGRFGSVSIRGLNERVGQIFAALGAQAVDGTSVNCPGTGERKWI